MNTKYKIRNSFTFNLTYHVRKRFNHFISLSYLATLPCSPSSNNKLKPNTTSASFTSKLEDNKKCSISENEIFQKQSDNKLQRSKSSQSSGNNSDEWDRPTIAKDFSSEPCPHLLVFNSYKNDTLPISNIFATDFNRDNKSISRTTKATIDEGR